MNSAQAAELIKTLHGSYPGTYFDGAVAEAFANSFITNDYAAAKPAVQEWVATMERFPTIAELNRMIRRIRDDQAPSNVYQLAAPEYARNTNDARSAFARGYRQSRVRAGDTELEIEAKLAGYHKNVPGLE
jgi:hypothetical protein